MALLTLEALLREEKSSVKLLPAVGIEPRASHSLWFQVQHYPFYINLTLACKTVTLGSVYSHDLLILLKSSKFKYQVVHEQMFKDHLSSTCQVSVERMVLDLESEVMRGLGSIPTWYSRTLGPLCYTPVHSCPDWSHPESVVKFLFSWNQ